MKTILKHMMLAVPLLILVGNVSAQNTDFSMSPKQDNERWSSREILRSREKTSFRHSIGMDFYPFWYNLKFQGKEQVDIDYFVQTWRNLNFHETKFWNLYYEYSLNSKNRNDKIRTSLKVGFFGYYHSERGRTFDIDGASLTNPHPFPYRVNYKLQNSALGGSVGVNREHFLYGFFGYYSGIDFIYTARTTVFDWSAQRFWSHSENPFFPTLNETYLERRGRTIRDHLFALAPQIGLSFRLSEQLIIRVGGTFAFSYTYKTFPFVKTWAENPDGTIFMWPGWGYMFIEPSKFTLNINPQITINYAF